jgi:hypothetical protein
MIARSDDMKKSKDKPANTGPVELSEKELGEVAGGIELEPVFISSYQLSATKDGTPDVIVAAGAGGGPHVR